MLAFNEYGKELAELHFGAIRERLINTMTDQQKCSYGFSYVQLKFNFQILNVQTLYKLIKTIEAQTEQTQNPCGNHLCEIPKFAKFDPQRLRMKCCHV